MALIEELKAIVGKAGWKELADDLRPHTSEWRGQFQGVAALLLAPRSTDEVSAVMRLCHAAGVAVVPQGGNTGMCAGAIPDESGKQIILSLSRMNRIRDLDVENASVEVEAGCILANVQQAASESGLFFPLSLGAEGSCQVGGNLSTDAGGVNVIRYGTARAQVLGLEAVMADGTVVNSLRSLRKDTAGYDLKQLFIGSEGTLGVITAASLRLWPDPGERSTALIALRRSEDAVTLLARIRAAIGERIEAFELISRFVLGLVKKHVADGAVPFDINDDWYVLMDAVVDGDTEALQHALMQALEDGIATDVIIAKSSTEAGKLWQMRHSISSAERAEGAALKHDIAVPVSRMSTFLQRSAADLAKLVPNAQLVVFGHVGDGNLHYNVMLPPESGNAGAVSDAIYTLVTELGGSISAEHGIGQAKRAYLSRYRSDSELALMRLLKKAVDPANILNPGKVI